MTRTASRTESVRALEVVLTTACNLSCPYCFQSIRDSRFMEWEVLQAALDLLLRSASRDPVLCFYGGEPLLALPLIRRAADYIEAERPTGTRFKLRMSTNGMLLDRDTIRFLARHRIETQLSFDGIPEAQDLRTPGTFERLDRALAELADEEQQFFRDLCSVSITLGSRNVAYLGDSFSYLLGRGVREVAVSPLATHDPGWCPETIEVLQEQIASVFQTSVEHLQRCGQVPFAPFRQSTSGTRTGSDAPTMCRATGTEKLAVDVDGQVYGCVMFVESYQTLPHGMLRDCLVPMRLGDLRAPDFAERLEQYPAAAHAARIFDNKQDKYSSYGRCSDCRFLYRCSVCPVSIAHIRGYADPDRVPDLQCALNLVLLEYRERFPGIQDLLRALTKDPDPPDGLKLSRPALGQRGQSLETRDIPKS